MLTQARRGDGKRLDVGPGAYATRTVLKKRGNSASVRIPKHMLESVRLGMNGAVELREESGRIVIEPLNRRDVQLAELLEGITKEPPSRKRCWTSGRQ
jgi:antitoxin MazE